MTAPANNEPTRRPYMTRNRRRVLAALVQAKASGERLRLAELARRCGLHDFRNARRTKRDLERLGLV